MACTETASFPTGMSGNMTVIEKYSLLMGETLSDDSLYNRTKDTFYELFKDLEIDAKEKAQIVAEAMAQMATQMSSTAMQSAVAWAKEERDGYYSTALLYSQVMKTQADAKVSLNEICKTEAEVELTCAKITSTIADSIRTNGRVASYEQDSTCKPLTLLDENFKYEQTLMVEQQTTSMVQDDLRKNAKNTEDIAFSVRQRQSFEDSKRNHAANASAQMISGLIAAEISLVGNEDLISYWVLAMQYLTSEQV